MSLNAALNLFNNLLGPSRSRAPSSASTPPTGGEAWNVGFNFDTYQPSGPTPGTYAPASGAAVPITAFDEAGLRQAMLTIFQRGVGRDLASASQLRSLATTLPALNAAQLTTLRDLLNQSFTAAEQTFILKSFVAREPWANVVQYAQEMRGLSEDEIVRRSTMRDTADVIQQWQDACGPAVLQAIAGEADPRYAWELNKAGDVATIDPSGAAQAIAEQQRSWLEQYGGKAVERGRSGGQGIAIGQALNDNIAAITGANYMTTEVTNTRTSFDRVQGLLEAGYDVPLRVEWSPPGAGPGNGHFILAMQVRGLPGSREFQVHDPWTGKTAWVAESEIQRNSFAPIFSGYARLTHTYDAQPAA